MKSSIHFFQLVQHEAEKQHAVFFLDCAEGHDFEADRIEGEDLRGWLIPSALADALEREWRAGDPSDQRADDIVWAIWHGTVQRPIITFMRF